MNAHPKPARVDLGDGDSLILFRTDDYHTTVRFHSANPNTSLAGAVMATDALRAALDGVAPAESPDLADGGVTCAAIEKEADTRTREHLLSEEGRLLSLEKSLRAHLSRTIARAEKAEGERDDALWLAKVGADQANDALGMAARGECHDCIRDAAVTDAEVERAWHVSNTLREDRWPSREEIRQILTAAATPEPQRPEGLTALIEAIRTATYDPEPVATGEALYNAGVRAPNLDGHLPACEGGPGLPCDTCGSYWAGDTEDER